MENISQCLTFLASLGVNVEGLSAKGKLYLCTFLKENLLGFTKTMALLELNAYYMKNKKKIQLCQDTKIWYKVIKSQILFLKFSDLMADTLLIHT